MSATERTLTTHIVVADYDQQPPWLRALVERTGLSCDDLVVAMLEHEMEVSGRAFVARFPELFKAGTELM